MENRTNTTSSFKKPIHIAGIALAMTLTLGVAVAVSGHPADNVSLSSTHIHSAAQSPLLMQAVAPVESIKAQPELMHDAPAVELKTVAEVKAPISHTRIMKMVVTAYCPCTKCCGENAAGITASGKLVDYNDGHFVAADPSLHFGTKVIIPGYASSSVEVQDRGGAIKGNHIDVFFPTHEEALQWGKQTLNVIVVD